MLLGVLISFLPWVVFAAFSGNTLQSLQVSIVASFLTVLAVSYRRLREGLILDWATFVFFGLSSIEVVFFKNLWIAQHIGVFAYLVLAGIAWGSVFLKRPFTSQCSKPPENASPQRLLSWMRVHNILSISWAILFSLNTLIAVFKLYFPFNIWVFVLWTHVNTGFGIAWTAVFPGLYRKYLAKSR